MQVDSHYAIGQSHLVCEDYARAGLAADGVGYAVVSDGCSGSPDTDVGARLMALVASNCIRNNGLPPVHRGLRSIAGQARDGLFGCGLDLGVSSLDATLLAAHVSKRTVNIVVAGDGVVVARRRSGELEMWEVDYGGTPAYPSYLLEPDRLSRYLGEGLGKRKVTHSLLGIDDGEQLSVEAHDLTNAGFDWRLELDRSRFDLVLLFSDGVSSFFTRGCRGEALSVPTGRVVAEVANLKTTTGAFLARRCRRFLSKFCTANNWQHADDFSVAGIYLGGES